METAVAEQALAHFALHATRNQFPVEIAMLVSDRGLRKVRCHAYPPVESMQYVPFLEWSRSYVRLAKREGGEGVKTTKHGLLLQYDRGDAVGKDSSWRGPERHGEASHTAGASSAQETRTTTRVDDGFKIHIGYHRSPQDRKQFKKEQQRLSRAIKRRSQVLKRQERQTLKQMRKQEKQQRKQRTLRLKRSDQAADMPNDEEDTYDEHQSLLVSTRSRLQQGEHNRRERIRREHIRREHAGHLASPPPPPTDSQPKRDDDADETYDNAAKKRTAQEEDAHDRQVKPQARRKKSIRQTRARQALPPTTTMACSVKTSSAAIDGGNGSHGSHGAEPPPSPTNASWNQGKWPKNDGLLRKAEPVEHRSCERRYPLSYDQWPTMAAGRAVTSDMRQIGTSVIAIPLEKTLVRYADALRLMDMVDPNRPPPPPPPREDCFQWWRWCPCANDAPPPQQEPFDPDHPHRDMRGRPIVRAMIRSSPIYENAWWFSYCALRVLADLGGTDPQQALPAGAIRWYNWVRQILPFWGAPVLPEAWQPGDAAASDDVEPRHGAAFSPGASGTPMAAWLHKVMKDVQTALDAQMGDRANKAYRGAVAAYLGSVLFEQGIVPGFALVYAAYRSRDKSLYGENSLGRYVIGPIVNAYAPPAQVTITESLNGHVAAHENLYAQFGPDGRVVGLHYDRLASLCFQVTAALAAAQYKHNMTHRALDLTTVMIKRVPPENRVICYKRVAIKHTDPEMVTFHGSMPVEAGYSFIVSPSLSVVDHSPGTGRSLAVATTSAGDSSGAALAEKHAPPGHDDDKRHAKGKSKAGTSGIDATPFLCSASSSSSSSSSSSRKPRWNIFELLNLPTPKPPPRVYVVPTHGMVYKITGFEYAVFAHSIGMRPDVRTRGAGSDSSRDNHPSTTQQPPQNTTLSSSPSSCSSSSSYSSSSRCPSSSSSSSSHLGTSNNTPPSLRCSTNDDLMSFVTHLVDHFGLDVRRLHKYETASGNAFEREAFISFVDSVYNCNVTRFPPPSVWRACVAENKRRPPPKYQSLHKVLSRKTTAKEIHRNALRPCIRCSPCLCATPAFNLHWFDRAFGCIDQESIPQGHHLYRAFDACPFDLRARLHEHDTAT